MKTPIRRGLLALALAALVFAPALPMRADQSAPQAASAGLITVVLNWLGITVPPASATPPIQPDGPNDCPVNTVHC